MNNQKRIQTLRNKIAACNKRIAAAGKELRRDYITPTERTLAEQVIIFNTDHIQECQDEIDAIKFNYNGEVMGI